MILNIGNNLHLTGYDAKESDFAKEGPEYRFSTSGFNIDVNCPMCEKEVIVKAGFFEFGRPLRDLLLVCPVCKKKLAQTSITRFWFVKCSYMIKASNTLGEEVVKEGKTTKCLSVEPKENEDEVLYNIFIFTHPL